MRWILFLLASGAGWAQLSGPVLGLVPDGSRIRQMNGIPGAAMVGDAWITGRNFSNVAVSSRPDFALAISADGEVVMLPSSVPLNGVLPNPSRIVISPRGSAAAFWYPSTSRFQVVSGLPGTPSVRTIDATFLGDAPVAFAVSDDGNWLAGAWDSGVYAFADGSVNRLSADGTFSALAFFSQRSDLVLANPQRVYSIADPGSKATVSILYDRSNKPFSPAGIATSLDNTRVVLADSDGSIVSIDPGTGLSSQASCDCRPDGVFGLGGSVFRLTGVASGVKLFDASSTSVFVVPGRSVIRAKGSFKAARPQAVAPLPALNIAGLPATTGFSQQPAMTISLSAAYPTDVTGTATLTFASSVGGDDQLIQFGTGGRTVNFTIPAGSTQANFAGKSSVTVLTGTVAGITTVAITSVSSAGTSFTGPFAQATITTNPTVPFISTVSLTTSATGITVVVTGFASTRDMVSGLFHFAPSMTSTLAQSDITVSLSNAFTTWYQNPASNAFGSEFTLTVPFTTQGSGFDIVAVTVTLTDSKGASNPVSQ